MNGVGEIQMERMDSQDNLDVKIGKLEAEEAGVDYEFEDAENDEEQRK